VDVDGLGGRRRLEHHGEAIVGGRSGTGRDSFLRLDPTYVTPDIHVGLVSAGKLQKRGYSTHLQGEGFFISPKQCTCISEGDKIMVGELLQDSLRYRFLPARGEAGALLYSGPPRKQQTPYKISGHMVHDLYGHIGPKPTAALLKAHEHDWVVVDVGGLAGSGRLGKCVVCHLTHSTFKPSYTGAHLTVMARAGEGLSGDSTGKFPLPVYGGFNYFLLFVDDATRCLFAFLMKQRTAEVCVGHLAYVMALGRTHTGNVLKQFRSDGEWISEALKAHLRANGVFPMRGKYDPNKNAIAESWLKQVFRIARAIMVARCVPYQFLGYAAMHAVFIINAVPYKEGRPRYEVFFNRKLPHVSFWHVFGCLCYRHVGSSKGSSTTSELAVYLGHSLETSSYYVWSSTGRKVIEEKNLDFVDHIAGWPTIYPKGGMANNVVSEFVMTDLKTGCRSGLEEVLWAPTVGAASSC